MSSTDRELYEALDELRKVMNQPEVNEEDFERVIDITNKVLGLDKKETDIKSENKNKK